MIMCDDGGKKLTIHKFLSMWNVLKSHRHRPVPPPISRALFKLNSHELVRHKTQWNSIQRSKSQYKRHTHTKYNRSRIRLNLMLSHQGLASSRINPFCCIIYCIRWLTSNSPPLTQALAGSQSPLPASGKYQAIPYATNSHHNVSRPKSVKEVLGVQCHIDSVVFT